METQVMEPKIMETQEQKLKKIDIIEDKVDIVEKKQQNAEINALTLSKH